MVTNRIVVHHLQKVRIRDNCATGDVVSKVITVGCFTEEHDSQKKKYRSKKTSLGSVKASTPTRMRKLLWCIRVQP